MVEAFFEVRPSCNLSLSISASWALISFSFSSFKPFTYLKISRVSLARDIGSLPLFFRHSMKSYQKYIVCQFCRVLFSSFERVVEKCMVMPVFSQSKKNAVQACMTDVAAFTSGSMQSSFTEKMLKLDSPEQTKNGNVCSLNPGIISMAYLFQFFWSKSWILRITYQFCTMKR